MNKTLMICLFAMLALLMINSVSAAIPNVAPYPNGVAYGYGSYGSYPVNPSLTQNVYSYPQTPVRVGGFYGQNSAFLIGLRPGYYDGPVMNGYARQVISSAYYPRVGGYYGYYNGGASYYYNLRPGMTVYNGAGRGYASPSYLYHGTL